MTDANALYDLINKGVDTSRSRRWNAVGLGLMVLGSVITGLGHWTGVLVWLAGFGVQRYAIHVLKQEYVSFEIMLNLLGVRRTVCLRCKKGVCSCV